MAAWNNNEFKVEETYSCDYLYYDGAIEQFATYYCRKYRKDVPGTLAHNCRRYKPSSYDSPSDKLYKNCPGEVLS